MIQAYPLHWPEGWPRTSANKQLWSLPGGRLGASGWNAGIDRLTGELRRLGAKSVVVSTNQPLRRDGLPYAATRRIEDPGSAVYFTLNETALVMAQDRYELLSDNIRSLAIAIEGLRKTQRHGGALMMERAFSGFQALPQPDAGRHWTEVLAVDATATLSEAKQSYRRRARDLHPDLGGTDQAMTELNLAWQQAQAEIVNG